MIRNVFLITNTSCNQTCSYCFYNTGLLKNVGGFLNHDNLRKFLDKGVERMSITGGEPLINPYLFEYIKIATNVSKNVILSTNGKLLTSQVIERLKNLGIKKIFISLDDLSGNFDRKYRGFHALTTVKNALQANMRVEISSVITTENIDKIFDLQEFCLENNINFWPTPLFCNKRNKLDLSNLRAKEWKEIIGKIPLKYKDTKAAKFLKMYYRIFVKKDIIVRTCPLTDQLIINVDGDITRCFFGKSIGNIENSKLSKIKLSNEKKVNCFGQQCFQHLI